MSVHKATKVHTAAKKDESPKTGDDPKKAVVASYVDKDGYEDTAKSHRACAVNLVSAWYGKKSAEAVVKLKGCSSLRLQCMGGDQFHKECSYSVSVDGKKAVGGKWTSTPESPERTIPSSAPGKESRFEVKVQGVK